MVKREKISKAFKLNLVLQVLQQKLPVKEVANINSISEGQLRDWIRRYKVSGEGAKIIEVTKKVRNSFRMKKFLKEKIKS